MKPNYMLPVFYPIILVCTLFSCRPPAQENLVFAIKDTATLREANAREFRPGETIEVRTAVNGRLVLTESGAAGNPITITGGQLTGIDLTNCGNVTVRGVTVTGEGESGIVIYSDDKKRYGDITIQRVTAHGYPYAGISVHLPYVSDAHSLQYPGGFDNLLIRDCITYNNDYAGIAVYGAWPGIQHRNVRVINCQAYDAAGVDGMRPHSGHGIVMAGVDGGLIDSCGAWNNGWEYGHGNIGIWTHDARNIIIQNSRSVRNISTTGIDGGGFDIDGGAENCTIQNCYSEGNDGAGYLLYEYGSPNPFTHNYFIRNTSIGDGTGNRGYSAFTVGGNVPVPGAFFIQSNNAQPLPGRAAVTYSGHRPTNITITNNSWQ